MAELQIIESFVTNNPCYKQGKTITVKGLMLHSIGCPQPSATVLINNFNKASHSQSCVHGFIDANTGVVYQAMPWNRRAWHCGSGSKGSGNNTHVGVEMCEPAQIKYTGGSSFTYDNANLSKIQDAVKKTYSSAVKLFANLCKLYNLDPLADGVIVSHCEGHARGIASNHGDPEHLWKQTKVGFTMDGFRKAVAAEMGASTEPTPKTDPVTQEPVQPKTLYRVRKSADDAASQIGAYTSFANAKKAADSYPGYHVFDINMKDVYPVAVVPFKIQTTGNGLTIYKTPSKTGGQWSTKTKAGVFTIVKIQNGSGSSKGYGLLKAYSDRMNGWVSLDEAKIL